MVRIPRSRTGELLRELFALLPDHPEGMRARDALAALEQRVELSEYEQGFYGDVRRFEKIVRFSTIDTVKAGWMIKSNGRWSITEEGRRAVDTISDPEQFHSEASRLYRKWKNASDPLDDIDDPTLDEQIPVSKSSAVAYEEADESARDEIEKYIGELDPFEFQTIVAALLEGMGYHVQWVAQRSQKDGGVDVVAAPDPLGTESPRIKVQVKQRPEHKADVNDLRAFFGVLNENDVGVFVSTGGFTRDAESEARSYSKSLLTLVDLTKFLELWVENYPKLPESAKRTLPIKPIHFLSLSDL